MFFSADGKRCYTYTINEFHVGKSEICAITEDFVNCGDAKWIILPVYKTIGNGYIQFDIDLTEFRG